MSGSKATVVSATPRTAEPAAALAVAYSGGRDSSALLHATLRASRDAGIAVHALHVHHGLSAHADDWLEHCDAQCAAWAGEGLPVRFQAVRLSLGRRRGESLEALARSARYAALRRLALDAGVTLVLLAHHRRDQAETLLLQALRGAGVAGLSGMPESAERDGIVWARPWLGRPPAAIAAYARQHGLRWVEDDSNADPRFARNRVRLQVWPALEAAFPQAEATLAAAATWAQQARTVVDEIAAADLSRCADARGLDLIGWQTLGPPQQRHALRAWLRREAALSPPAALVERLVRELPATAPARWALAGGELRRYRGRLRFVPASRGAGPTPALPAGEPTQPVKGGRHLRAAHVGAGAAKCAQAAETGLQVRRAGRYRLPGWGGTLCVQRVSTGGVPLAALAGLRLAPRCGGEQFQASPRGALRSLKKHFQARAVPAEERTGPLCFHGPALLFVPGLGLDARALAAPGERQYTLDWHPDPPGG